MIKEGLYEQIINEEVLDHNNNDNNKINSNMNDTNKPDYKYIIFRTNEIISPSLSLN